jgi:hypothetical protein
MGVRLESGRRVVAMMFATAVIGIAVGAASEGVGSVPGTPASDRVGMGSFKQPPPPPPPDPGG